MTVRIPFILYMKSFRNQKNIYTSDLPAGFDTCAKKKKPEHHTLSHAGRGDSCKLWIFFPCTVTCLGTILLLLPFQMQEQWSCSVASHVTGSHFNILSERSGWYIRSCRGDSDLHATGSRWYTFTRPTQPVEQTDNESICVKHLCAPTPTPPPPPSLCEAN